MEEALRTLLLATTAVTDEVSTRIYWGERPQGSAVPALVLRVISKPLAYHMTGTSNPVEYRVQADCYGTTYSDAKLAARAVDNLLDGYNSGDFQGVFTVGERDLRDAGTNDADRLFGVSLDYLINYTAA